MVGHTEFLSNSKNILMVFIVLYKVGFHTANLLLLICI